MTLTISDRLRLTFLGDEVMRYSGSLTLTRQLTHDFPLGSYVSSALIIGDMKARVPLLFDQNTWDNTFKDVVVGSVAECGQLI